MGHDYQTQDHAFDGMSPNPKIRANPSELTHELPEGLAIATAPQIIVQKIDFTIYYQASHTNPLAGKVTTTSAVHTQTFATTDFKNVTSSSITIHKTVPRTSSQRVHAFSSAFVQLAGSPPPIATAFSTTPSDDSAHRIHQM